MITIALDLSTKSTGCAIFEGEELKEWHCITAASTDVIQRIKKITLELQKIITKYKNIQALVIEEVRPEDGKTSSKNLHTQKVLMWLQASVIFMLHDISPKTEIIYMYPSEWRKRCNIHTGRGIKRESLKTEDILFVKNTYNITVNDDVADACCLGYAHLHPGGQEDIIMWGE